MKGAYRHCIYTELEDINGNTFVWAYIPIRGEVFRKGINTIRQGATTN